MSDLHTRLRAAIEEKLDLAKAASQEWDDIGVVTTATPSFVAGDAVVAHIEAHDPAAMIHIHEAALDMLGVLRSWHHDPDCQMGRRELGGETCAHFDKRWRHECAVIVLDSLAASYGVPVDTEETPDPCLVCDGRGFYEDYDPVAGRMLQWPCAACRQTGVAP